MAKTPSSANSGAPLVQALADILDKTGLVELEYETEAVSIRLSKATPAMMAQPVAAAPVAAAPAPAAAPPAEAPAAGNDTPADDHPGAVPSPMVGTVYLSPEPGASAFINEGDTVREGQTLVIIEAMKVMNPIAAPKAGTVTRILISNAQPVEYGQALVIVE
ncbi:MAG: acetyl-CoA carboxylase, biotin carboxyl carrier protein [SAR116 cluster bacterium MED-G04]|jgi:acetyl-CoA carboxylase biotin carboxyl carrier protein|nr:acetyl-CoA carboxylase, biotin carboxyl carrier protein [SAR116 cluster bacterium]OUW36720.1 MAG: acetyl-CoA carboxylase, biotin carboxyl carrier protein [Gammaproteobacteria bacterium TMED183]PDH65540.1 MAG: acetyl-CoA carboxylase, biotin carboxyl carrier protein [SAR116 cluster bacterium MED-G04]HCD49915.1 acetyl-CoA carboxylase biotin carboxyl carrier protein [Alphaproteobacteria bacterium]CAI8318952.1 MAG: Biotin carboxyl carrier protein of acetyl-CoA carboxylase [SAR116 cluster bacteriu|tara:strand:- start:3554 stop:4039 length:486 start_codon:yes stop_codon:yes gene_type:complete